MTTRSTAPAPFGAPGAPVGGRLSRLGGALAPLVALALLCASLAACGDGHSSTAKPLRITIQAQLSGTVALAGTVTLQADANKTCDEVGGDYSTSSAQFGAHLLEWTTSYSASDLGTYALQPGSAISIDHGANNQTFSLAETTPGAITIAPNGGGTIQLSKWPNAQGAQESGTIEWTCARAS